MKLFMATMGLGIGGAETHLVELSKELRERGHEVLVASNGGVYVEEIRRAGIVHYSVPMHHRNIRDMIRSRRKLREIFLREKPDLVHAHARIPAFLCGGLCKSLSIPFVTSCHFTFQLGGLVRLLSNWGEHTLAVSEDIRDYLMEEYGVPGHRITVTINGIDTKKFSPQCSGEEIRREYGLEGPICLGHVSRLDQAPAWTARQLIELAPRLDQALPGLQILITGDGDQYASLCQRAEEVNAQLGRTCLILTGPRTDINQVLAACDLFVGVSRAALEAMAEARPVILSGAQGHMGLFRPEQLSQGMETNFCCRTHPVATQEILFQSIVEGCSLQEEERERLGAYGRWVVQEYYSVQRMTEDCLAVYERVRKRAYHVVVSGYYGFSNAGDDAILQSIHQAIRSASQEIAVTVLSKDPKLTWELCGLESVPRFHFWKVLRALKECDALLSGGGSLLQDRTSTRSLLYYLSIIWGAVLFQRPVMLYANGIGPVRKRINRYLVKCAAEEATLVTLRDSSSERELREMGVKRKDLYVTADPVFHLQPAPQECGRALLREAKVPEGSEFVAVSVRRWSHMPEFDEIMGKVCDHIKRTYHCEILFLMMQPKHDQKTTQQVRQAMEESSHCLDVSCTPRELMAVLGEAKLCLAMRLHTLIFSARMEVPCIGLVYDPKIESYLRELDMPSAGHVEQLNLEDVIACVDDMMANYDQRVQRLQKKARSLAQASQRNEELLLHLLKTGRGEPIVP